MPRKLYDACVIGASAGGVGALIELLSHLSPDLAITVVVVLHTGPQASGLAEVLGQRSKLPVKSAEHGLEALPGRVWLAPPGYHLLVENDRRFSLSIDEKVCFVRPAADVLFTSAADVWHQHLIGVVLTGGNEDGAAGLREIRSRGGLAIVQSPEDAEVPAMPEAALRIAGADHTLALKEIAPLLNQLAIR